jgi:16S rRNA (cytidine1402-2'-O)-methyltransferase
MLRYNTAMGILYLVATPIGNLEDITHRAIRVLSEVELIAAEDTRHTRKLLQHYALNTPMISYHEFSKPKQLIRILETLESTDIALVSDAGTPGLSDPGYELVKQAIERGYRVSPIPGPSAPIAALVASGLPTESFLYLGYLPRKPGPRRDLIRTLKDEPRTAVFFEVPHRIKDALQDIEALLGSDREVALCRELSKMHEQILRGTVQEIREALTGDEPRGEFTLVLGGVQTSPRWTEEEVRQALAQRTRNDQSPSQAAREIARESGWSRGDIYRLGLEKE